MRQLVLDTGEVQKVQNIQSPLLNLTLFRAHGGRPRPELEQGFARLIGGHHHQVFKNGQLAELVGYLERSDDAAMEHLMGRKAGDVLAVQKNPPGSRCERASDHVEAGGLAGTIRPDQPGDSSGLDLETAVLNRDQPAKAPLKLFDL